MDAGTIALTIILVVGGIAAVLTVLGFLASLYHFDHK
jgi:hypothetical protein